MATVLLALGCSGGADATIENRRVIRDVALEIPTLARPGEQKSVVLQVVDGEHEMLVTPSNVHVKSGVITIAGQGGRVEFHPDRLVRFYVPKIPPGVEVSTGSDKEGWAAVHLSVGTQPFGIILDWSNLTPPLKEVCAMRKIKPADLRAPLATETDKRHQVRFTITTSDDFVGAIGDWKLLSNWN